MRRRKRSAGEGWQSFADLAMGLVGVLLLIVVVLVSREAARAEEQEEVASELSTFFEVLLLVIQQAQAVESRQDEAILWVSRMFEETACPLRLNPETGELEPRDDAGAAGLYDPGATSVSPDARLALEECRAAFMQLAACMAPAESPLRDSCNYPEETRDLGNEVEALVLLGSTDRQVYRSAPRVSGAHGLDDMTDSFVDNAYLGSERARQALGHLLLQAQSPDEEQNRDPQEALHVLMSKVRIETSSFGRYQAGPLEWRDLGGRECGDADECEVARNLSLKLRWKEQTLRQPFSHVVDRFCDEWVRPESQLRSVLDEEHAAQAASVCQRRRGREERTALDEGP